MPFYDLPLPCPEELSRHQALTALLRQQIQDQQHLSFAQFMNAALYHPQYGYYQRPALTIGAQGDFTTASTISPLYAQCFATQFLEIFRMGVPNILLELGAGGGQFARDILLYMSEIGYLPSYYYIYEPSIPLRERQRQLLLHSLPSYLSTKIIWLEQLPTEFKGIIIANEVLDALPVHCFQIMNHQAYARDVTWQADKFTWQLNSPTKELSSQLETLMMEISFQEGYASEINLALSTFIPDLVQRVALGAIFFADYGYGRREYYHPQRQTGTLTCFYQHRKHSDPFDLVGLQDITAHVDFTYVIELATRAGADFLGYTSQAAFLLSCGLMDLAHKNADLSEKDQFTLNQAIKILTMPSEMGEVVKVMALGKNLSNPLIGFTLQDRSRDL